MKERKTLIKEVIREMIIKSETWLQIKNNVSWKGRKSQEGKDYIARER